MTAALDMLAERDDFLHLIGIVALLVISAVAAAIQWGVKKKQEKRAAEQERQGTVGGQPQPPRRRPQAEEEVARAMREVLGLEPEQLQVRQQPPPARPPRAKPKPQELQPTPETEVRQLLRPGGPTLTHLQTDLGPESRIPHRVAGVPSDQRQDQPPVRVALDDVQQARRAIVYYEIFSSPKALREGQEMWDL